jgi:hypothetical protein
MRVGTGCFCSVAGQRCRDRRDLSLRHLSFCFPPFVILTPPLSGGGRIPAIFKYEILRGVYPAHFQKTRLFRSAHNDKMCGAQDDKRGVIATRLYRQSRQTTAGFPLYPMSNCLSFWLPASAATIDLSKYRQYKTCRRDLRKSPPF